MSLSSSSSSVAAYRSPRVIVWVALGVVLLFHGGLLLQGTYRTTYDAYVHIFFADHWRRNWWDPWDTRWYTGFSLTSYPPLSQQLIALVSMITGDLRLSFVIVQTFALFMLTLGMFRFGRLWTRTPYAAAWGTLLMITSTAITETVHVFGQLPTTLSLSMLLNALPFAHRWVKQGGKRSLLFAWALVAATTGAHHVTTLFGLVFIIAPVLASALLQNIDTALPKSFKQLRRRKLKPILGLIICRARFSVLRAGIFGVGAGVLLITVVLPYWLWSRSDPINQISIPHASRDNFLVNLNAGLVFWLIPYGMLLFALPYIFATGYRWRTLPLMLSISAMILLGTGGTTPIPRMILGGAFDILTLDRFTFWAVMLMYPLAGEFALSLQQGGVARKLQVWLGVRPWLGVQVGLTLGILGTTVFCASLSQYKPMQPAPIDPQPIVNFLEKDQHDRWRYLTLGFGDQMAWLSAQSTAAQVDGNYHSARRLPELTTTPVERLEGAKYSGVPGIGSLQQFVTVPDKYNLKFIFSNDPFYDPLLFFSGWHRLQRLENGIAVWEREDIAPLPEEVPRKDIPMYQRIMFGTLPFSAFISAMIAMVLGRHQMSDDKQVPIYIPPPIPARARTPLPRWRQFLNVLLIALMLTAFGGWAAWQWLNYRSDPESVITDYYQDLDFRRFKKAYSRLAPDNRPEYDQYLLNLSAKGGLVASYAKLSDLKIATFQLSEDVLDAKVQARYITALSYYTDTQSIRLTRDLSAWLPRWQVLFPGEDIRLPPDSFLRKTDISYAVQPQRKAQLDSGLDRPQVRIMSSRLVARAGIGFSLVGELSNDDVDPADVTLTARLFDAAGEQISIYNAGPAMFHKLLPYEVTPFRVDFDGVSNVPITRPLSSYDVFAKALVTSRDLDRDIGTQQLRVMRDVSGQWMLYAQLINNGVSEATIPHVMVTYYDQGGKVAWVDDLFVNEAIRSQRTLDIALPLTTASMISSFPTQQQGPLPSINGTDELDGVWLPADILPLPAETGYAYARVMVHMFSGSGQ